MPRDISDVDALNRDSGSVYRVTKKGMGWAVEKQSTLFGDASTGYSTKEQAVKAGRRKRKKDDVLIIERADGSVQSRIGN